MKTRKLFVYLSIFCFCLILYDVARASKDAQPKRLKRSESFLGIHFDFHAGDDCTEIGKDVDPEMVAYILELVKPDYVQCDCKGHPGLSSYPTKIGNPAPGFVKDPLKIWREVTAEHGVALYLHYSGIWDEAAVRKHPDWARMNEKGEVDKRLTSVFGPYIDSLLIPQLQELADNYQVDGVWVDGECWALERDYRPAVLQMFQKKTGILEIPRKMEDPFWFEFSQFNRQGFRDYLNHYVTILHQHHPAFQIASNWAYSSFMPEPATIEVDFISGDYSARNSFNSARLEGRCMVHQGKPWDLMAWSFTWTDGLYSTKSLIQLKQEAAVVLALGGGFQAYFPQKRDASIRKWQMPIMAELAKFCRERQSFCHKAEMVPQIGLIFSSEALYQKSRKLFGSWSGETQSLSGILRCLLDGQNVVDIVSEHHLTTERIQQYPLLIYPEWEYIDPNFKTTLLNYIEKGGNLLIIGPKAIALFEKELNIKLIDEPIEQVNGLACNGFMAGLKSLYQKVNLNAGVQPFGEIYSNNDFYGEMQVAASITQFGQGKMAGVYLNLGERYMNAATTVSRDFLTALVRTLFREPIVMMSGSHSVDISIGRKDKKLMVNLVNSAGPHANEKVNVFDEIPVVGPLSIVISHPKPQSVILQPANKKLKYRYENGKISLTLQKLELHEIIEIE